MPRKCIEEGCVKTPSYNFSDKKSPIYCAQHKLQEMVCVKQRSINKCQYELCSKSANFNYKDKKRGIYCSIHKEQDMINISSRVCIEENCQTIPVFNIKDEKYPIYCSKHKKDDMIDVCHKLCEEPNCKKLPCYATIGEKYGRYCATHKKDGMINVVNTRCVYDGCDKHAAFNLPGLHSKLYCSTHKQQGMIIVNGIYCKEAKCNTIANYNYEGKVRGMYCVTHKKEGMIDVKNKRCKTPLCDIVSSKHFEGYCFRCFIYTFPDAEISRNFKTKEQSVISYIKEKFPQYTFQTDKRIIDGCSKRRPDCLLDLGDQVIICEIDENQHIIYDCSCENKRVMELSQDVNHRPIIFIRFNPDSYTNLNGENIKSCWEITKRGICKIKKSKDQEWKSRLDALSEQLQYWIDNRTTKTIEVVQLFYSSQ